MRKVPRALGCREETLKFWASGFVQASGFWGLGFGV